LKQPFILRCSNAIFSDEELEALETYGTWLEALFSGQLSPTTEKQFRFVKAVRGEIDAETAWERLWIKYSKRLKWENESPHEIGKIVINDPSEAWFPREAVVTSGFSEFFSK